MLSSSECLHRRVRHRLQAPGQRPAEPGFQLGRVPDAGAVLGILLCAEEEILKTNAFSLGEGIFPLSFFHVLCYTEN